MAHLECRGEWSIREQIIEDPVSGLIFQFETQPNGYKALRIFGNSLQWGNREFLFDANGREAGAGTVVNGLCKPAWVYQVDG